MNYAAGLVGLVMKQILFVLGIFTLILTVSFKPPNEKRRIEAIGQINGLDEILKKVFAPAGDFRSIPVPQSGDWLAEHDEPGQTFDDFVKSMPNKPDKIRSTIYLQPIGEFPNTQIPFVKHLKEYAAAYYTIPVEMLAPITLTGHTITTRINPHTGNRQLLTGDVLSFLKKNVPADAFCVLAITMEDLYPEPSWNFVFGQASLRERVGVYSFARYDPVFYGQKRGPDYEKILLRRSCKVMVHEIAHMFGLLHCIYFSCALNGSNHLEESDFRPMHLCPVCLHKLYYSIGFDPVNRYVALFSFYRDAGFDDEARWVQNHLEHILGSGETEKIIRRKTSK